MYNPEQMKKVDALGWTPLHYAAFKGNLKAIRLLLQGDKFSTSYMVDKFGLSALHIAAYKGHLEVMKEMIQNRPDTCECRSSKGQTILHVAVLGAQSNVVKYIVNTPELEIRLVHQADKERHTPLHLAVISQNQEIIRTLGGGNIDEEFSLVFDNFLGDKIEVQEIIDGGYEGGFFGVSLFQEQINRDFKKLEYHPVNIFLDKNKCQESGKSAIVDDNKKYLAASDIDLLIATLMTTVTFAAYLNPPGGYADDGKMILRENAYFKWFQLFNNVSFLFTSLFLFFNCIAPCVAGTPLELFRPGRSCIAFSFFSMVFAYILGGMAAHPDPFKIVNSMDDVLVGVSVGLGFSLFGRGNIRMFQLIWNHYNQRRLSHGYGRRFML